MIHMISKEEILAKIKEVEIKSTILAHEIFGGNYRSFFRGNGMEFANIRKYYMGDDVKKIDWKTSARMGRTYVKEFDEEREVSVYLAVDVSNSQYFQHKMELLGTLVGSFAMSAHNNGDKVGCVLFSDIIEKYIPANTKRNQPLVIIDEIVRLTPQHKKTSINNALKFIYKTVTKKSIIVLISDFIDTGYDKWMNIVGQKHQLIPIRIYDENLEKLPYGAIFRLRDSETGEHIAIENYDKNIDVSTGNINKNILSIGTNDDIRGILHDYFAKYHRMRGVWQK